MIPGWGQYYREDKIRGITYFSLSIIALGATAYNYKQYNKAKTDLASKNSMSGIYSASPELLPLGITMQYTTAGRNYTHRSFITPAYLRRFSWE